MSVYCGTEWGYRQHVRDQSPKCAPCRRAHADTRADYRRRRYLHHAPLKVDATGTRRRIQALAAIGWSLAAQSQRLGWKPSTAHAVSSRSWVWPQTAEKVRGLYDELSMVPGPNNRARGEAARKGWLPPLAFDDESIDDPDYVPTLGDDTDTVDELAIEAVLDGHRLVLEGATAHAAVHLLTGRGFTPTQIGLMCGLAERRVYRLRDRDTAPHRRAA